MGGAPGGRALFAPLKEKDWAHDVAAAADVALAGRFDERFADRAVEIGRRVVFRAAGEAPTCEVRQSSVLRPPAVSCSLQSSGPRLTQNTAVRTPRRRGAAKSPIRLEPTRGESRGLINHPGIHIAKVR